MSSKKSRATVTEPDISEPPSRLTIALENVGRPSVSPPASEPRKSSNMSSLSLRKLKHVHVDTVKQELTECCLTHVHDSYRLHRNRVKGLRILDMTMGTIAIQKIGADCAIHMVWAALSCIYHFLLRLRAENGFIQWFRRRQAKKSIRTFDKLMQFLVPSYYTVVFSATMTFLEEANIWEVEYFCSNLIWRVLRRADDKSRHESILQILGIIENTLLTNHLSSRQILQVLFEVLETERWSWIDKGLLEKFLDMYQNSLNAGDSQSCNFEPLEKGLETCLREMAPHFDDNQLLYMISRMLKVVVVEKIPENNLLTFGHVLENVTRLYAERQPPRPLPEKIIPLILKILASRHLLYSLLGHRVLHSVLDRCKNKLTLETPSMFLRNSHYDLVIKEFSMTDKLMFQKYRNIFHKSAISALMLHGTHKLFLEHLYVTIALFTLEIPCAYTAAAAVCLSMSLQDAALESKTIQVTQAHRIHATVISLISLVCHIHRAAVFYDYVETIADRRANFAPHLNPPLKLKYKYGQHHVLWNKMDLFFEDWETRYGLWRCFKSKQSLVVVHTRRQSEAAGKASNLAAAAVASKSKQSLHSDKSMYSGKSSVSSGGRASVW